MYTPFDKDIKDVRTADLVALKNAKEGWHVEYKSQMVNANALAKAVSAFANTYGGWLFLGVQEKCKENPVADKFPGIPDDKVDEALQRLRQSVAAYVNPAPFFKTAVFQGSCGELGLVEGMSIIAVEIPESLNTPHIHKDGRIYRRVADGSEPKPETDRFILDQLWLRAKPIRKLTRQWVRRDPELSEDEKKNPYLRLLFCVDPWLQKDPYLDASISTIRSILGSTESEIGRPAIPFDEIHLANEEFIARQVTSNQPNNYVMTWRIKRDISCDIVFPLTFYTPSEPDLLRTSLNGYNYEERFIQLLKESGHTQPRIVDLNFLMSLLTGFVSKYRCLLKLAGADGDFFFKARLINGWRVSPFLDIETVLRDFEAHGLPIVLDRILTVPRGEEPETFQPVREEPIDSTTVSLAEEQKELLSTTVQAMRIFVRLAMAFGVQTCSVGETSTDDYVIPHDELWDAGKRAMTAQNNRSEFERLRARRARLL